MHLTAQSPGVSARAELLGPRLPETASLSRALYAQAKMVLQQDLADEQKTAIQIAHDLAEAVLLLDRVLVMSSRSGTIIDEMKIGLADHANRMARQRTQRVKSAPLMDLLNVQGRRGCSLLRIGSGGPSFALQDFQVTAAGPVRLLDCRPSVIT